MDTVIPLPGTFTVARLPTAADVDAIASTEDPCVRNLRITHAYHRLASAFAASSPGPGANWCVFATWASKQAGQTIRGEDVLQAIQRALDTRPEVEAALDGMFRRAVRLAFGRHGSKRKQILRILGTDAFHRASAAVGAGNLKVFAEIGREFARFLPLCTGGRVDPRALDAFLAGLRPGDPPEGQEYLRRAFTHYGGAMEAADPRERRSCCTSPTWRSGSTSRRGSSRRSWPRWRCPSRRRPGWGGGSCSCWRPARRTGGRGPAPRPPGCSACSASCRKRPSARCCAGPSPSR